MPFVLLIEDNAPLRTLLAEALAKDGHEVWQAADGRLGMNLLEKQPVDVVITDLVMPNLDGIETLTRLRKSHPRLPVIAISGDAPRNTELYLTFASKLGAVRILRKPFSAAALVATVREVLDSGRPTRAISPPQP